MFSWRCFPFVDSTPRAYRLKASNAAPLISTSAGTSPFLARQVSSPALMRNPIPPSVTDENSERKAKKQHRIEGKELVTTRQLRPANAPLRAMIFSTSLKHGHDLN
jgi:hypothetical protein